VPRTRIAPTLRHIGKVSATFGLTSSNIFHAGDGNMHPIILFDARKPGELERAKAAGDEILRFCVAEGGSITGEHGVGMEKMELIGEQFSDDSLEMIGRLKNLFDPTCRLNPGKMLPTGKGCMEIRQTAAMVV
jgi:glycolate oxidase